MSDLADRLQAALGDAYRIDRELGGGGMSHVFVARETALGRNVVLKVLPPEMAAGVNIERFQREIQLVASLQHPHIVPVLATGQVGDLFYYTMPLVEGESLRAKLAREGELPVADAIRILRDVVDALAYAHAHGVVHRDIKPDNVLISGQHAVVTDFGVAKAMSAATGSSTLTSLGLALGTPAYMSPEQAAADPSVDHRADLYAVGAMAYEMLCGRPPFSGMTPQQVLAAHVTLSPTPLNVQRPMVPPALNALVMRCLEKKPADRVQSAGEMLSQLQAMATPTGGMSPTGAQTALRRSNPVRVSLLFVLASIAVLAIVFVLREKLGLPDWVLPASVLLLAIGLPIVLITGRMERERMIAASTGTYRVPDSGVAKLLTWRKSLIGGALAFGVLIAIVTGYSIMRAFGIGSVGTLQAKGLLKVRQPIVLADFENRSPDSTLGPTLTEAFRVDLSQSQSVKLVDGQTVSDALTRMQKPPTSALTPALAREVAEREGIPALVAGEIDPVGKSFVVSVRVISAADASVLTAVRETAGSDADLIPALDRLSRELRERIGESLVSIRADQPLEHVTTGSLDALRKYTQAIRFANSGHDEEAVPLLEQATAIDTGFAMAWRELSVEMANTGGSLTKISNASLRAYQHRDRLPELEKQAATAWYFDAVDHQPPKIIAAYRAMLAIDPDNQMALNDLSLNLTKAYQFAAAESLAVHCMATGEFADCPINAVNAEINLGDSAAATRTFAMWSKGAPHLPTVLGTRFQFDAWRHDYVSAERDAHALAEAAPTSQYWQQDAREELTVLDGVWGRVKRAGEGVQALVALDETRGSPAMYVNREAQLAQYEFRLQVRQGEALASLSAALLKHPLETAEPSDRAYTAVAIAYALAGRPEEAQRVMAEYAREVPPNIQKGDPERFTAAGWIAMAEGHYAEAVASFEQSRLDNPCIVCNLFEIGAAYGKLSQPDSARVYYERYLTNGDLNRIYVDVDHLAAAYQRLGEIYETKGDRKRAIEYYLKLTDLWKDADPELQPIVKGAHQRIARLSGER
jgi:hypothetical protein